MIGDETKSWYWIFLTPGMFTVVGDPLAGYGLAVFSQGKSVDWGSAILVMVASLCFYWFGRLLNSCQGCGDGGMEGEPRVKYRYSLLWSLILVVSGVFCAFFAGNFAFIIAVILLGFMFFDHWFARHDIRLGPYISGICRMLNFAMGVFAVGRLAFCDSYIVSGMIFIFFYVTVITDIVRQNDVSFNGRSRWGPLMLLSAFYLVLFLIYFNSLFGVDSCFNPRTLMIVFSAEAAFAWNIYGCFKLKPGTSGWLIKRNAGKFLQGMPLVQASLLLLAANVSLLVALALILCFPLTVFWEKQLKRG